MVTNPASTITPRCVFWDEEMDMGFGDWSSAGCQVVSDTSNAGDVVQCECWHLSTFTVLLVSD